MGCRQDRPEEQSVASRLTDLRRRHERKAGRGRQGAGRGPAREGPTDRRERLSILLDEGSFQELGALATHQQTDFGMTDKPSPGT